jgi:hypothetical protein
VAKEQSCWQRAEVIAAGRKRRGLVLGARRQWAARKLELGQEDGRDDVGAGVVGRQQWGWETIRGMAERD